MPSLSKCPTWFRTSIHNCWKVGPLYLVLHSRNNHIHFLKAYFVFTDYLFFVLHASCAVNLFRYWTIPDFLLRANLKMGSWSSYEVIFCPVIVFKRIPRIQDSDRHLLFLVRFNFQMTTHAKESFLRNYILLSFQSVWKKQTRRQLEKLKSFFKVTQRIPAGNTFRMKSKRLFEWLVSANF